MQILKSLILGSEGSFNFLGVPVEFKPITAPDDLPIPSIVRQCIGIVSLAYAHSFAHQISHALVSKLLLEGAVKITISTRNFSSNYTFTRSNYKDASPIKRTIFHLAGPVAAMAFGTCHLVCAVALRTLLPWPVTLVLAGSAVVLMTRELIEAFIGSVKTDLRGDFGRIRLSSGTLMCVGANVALISQFALGIFAAYRLNRT